MSLVINHNQMSANTANILSKNYSRLQTSTQRLASGLRVNSAADDAAGLAIRELMRSEVAAYQQGARNANDAISMLQVADGALSIIDEKLIRMKELAEQAATGTYDSTQRLMIDSEFQAMGEEINRIARATDFNGIKLLDGSLSGAHDGSGLNATGKLKIHFGSMNDSAEDYYYVDIGNCTTKGLGLGGTRLIPEYGNPPQFSPGEAWLSDANTVTLDPLSGKIYVDISLRLAGNGSPQQVPGEVAMDFYELPVGLKNITATSNSSGFVHKPHINIFTKSGQQLTGINPDQNWGPNNLNGATTWWNMSAGSTSTDVVNKFIADGVLDAGAVYNGANVITQAGQSVTVGGTTISMLTSMNEVSGAEETVFISEITSDLVFMIGGHNNSSCRTYSLQIEADMSPELIERIYGQPTSYREVADEDAILRIHTQERAQEALERIDTAIVSKDKIRAHLGALQNRFENTVTNLTIQSENLQAAESRISDVDVATEMTRFVKNQILSQSAVSMLSQANSMPQMAMQLIGG